MGKERPLANSKGSKTSKKKVYDPFTFIGKEMVVYPSWVKPSGRRFYWFVLLFGKVVVSNYFLFFGVWVGVVLLQVLGQPQLQFYFCLVSFFGMIGLLLYKGIEAVNYSHKANYELSVYRKPGS